MRQELLRAYVAGGQHGPSHSVINRRLRGESVGRRRVVGRLARALDRLHSRCEPVTGVFYRGVRELGPLEADEGTLEGYLSTSRAQSVARSFRRNGHLLKVVVATPTKALDVGAFLADEPDDSVSTAARTAENEQEMLFPRGCRFRVIERGITVEERKETRLVRYGTDRRTETVTVRTEVPTVTVELFPPA